MTGIAGVLPGRHRRRFIDGKFALANQNAGQGRDHRFGRGIAEDRRIDAIAGRVALRDDVAILDDHDRLGVAERQLLGLGKRAIERTLQIRIRWLDHRSSGDLGQQRALLLTQRRRH